MSYPNFGMSFFYKLSLYFHTIRYLKPVQISNRIWRRLSSREVSKNQLAGYCLPSINLAPSFSRRPSMIGRLEFKFLNQSGFIENPSDWNSEAFPKLWLYNLHYFDDLNAHSSEQRQDWHHQLIERWVDENPPFVGTGWEPYPTSLRIVNWIKWLLKGNQATEKMQVSLALQARFLAKNIEYHILGNHLFSNGKALCFAGKVFEGEEASGWSELGLKIITQEIEEQVLTDGGHFERSPMYHNLFLEDVLDLYNLLNLPSLKATALKMLPVSRELCHPDGEIPLFNDAAFSIAPNYQELSAFSKQLGIEFDFNQENQCTKFFSNLGYLKMNKGAAVLFCDFAPVGPNYLPGHAHADTLSFELSVFGQRLIVNSGTSQYGDGESRAWERSTSAHTTVEVNKSNSSEVWGGFRVAKRAQVFDISIKDGESFSASAGHDGYKKIHNGPIHRREFILSFEKIIVKDRLIDGQLHNAVARYYFAPDTNIELFDATSGVIFHLGKKLRWRIEGGKARLKSAYYSPEFGLRVENTCLECEFLDRDLDFELRWETH